MSLKFLKRMMTPKLIFPDRDEIMDTLAIAVTGTLIIMFALVSLAAIDMRHREYDYVIGRIGLHCNQEVPLEENMSIVLKCKGD